MAGKAGGLAKPERKIFAIDTAGVAEKERPRSRGRVGGRAEF